MTLAIPGREHGSNSHIDISKHEHDGDIGTQYTAIVRRWMHLNPPLDNPVKVQKKRVSWWNISAQETRAEGINAIEADLGRELTLTEWYSMSVDQSHFVSGIVTSVIVWIV